MASLGTMEELVRALDHSSPRSMDMDWQSDWQLSSEDRNFFKHGSPGFQVLKSILQYPGGRGELWTIQARTKALKGTPTGASKG